MNKLSGKINIFTDQEGRTRYLYYIDGELVPKEVYEAWEKEEIKKQNFNKKLLKEIT